MITCVSNILTTRYRGHYHCFDVQPHRNPVFAFVTLPILLMVRLSGAPVGVEDALSCRSKVRVLSGVFRLKI